MECAHVHEISMLLTGFTAPGLSLIGELEQQMRDQMTRVERDVIDTKVIAANTAQSVRRVLRVVNAEVIDCPHLFTLVPEHPTGTRRLHIGQEHYRLTLWCEHPGYWHPWRQASYKLDVPQGWLTKISPIVKLIFNTLQVVIPLVGLVGSIADVVLPSKQLASAEDELRLMKSLVGDLPSEPGQNQGAVGFDVTMSHLTLAEGQALRGIRSVLYEHDPLRAFGGLRRVQEPSGDFMWVCEDHYPEYDPGLPEIP